MRDTLCKLPQKCVTKQGTRFILPHTVRTYGMAAEPPAKRGRCHDMHPEVEPFDDLTKHVLTNVMPSQISIANFAILKISECNASQNYSFTQVQCKTEMIAEDDGVPLLFEFRDIFSKGMELLSDVKNNARVLEKHEESAVAVLANYFKDIERHERSLQKVISSVHKEKKEHKRLCESELTVAFAEHLLGKLAPGKSYTVDIKMRKKGKCTCGFDHCNGKPKFGATGIGDVNAWHGFIDIVFSSHYGLPDSIGVAVSTSDDIEEGTDEEEEMEDFNSSPGGKGIVEVKIESNGTEDQALAQTIVFSFIQRRRHPEFQSLIPNILISSSSFRIIMYDSVQDILLCTAPIPLFLHITNEKKKLVQSSVILLWMVLHYRMFCVGIKTDDIENSDKIKLNFRNLAKDKYDIYLNLSKVDIQSFPSVPTNFYPSMGCILGGRPLPKKQINQ